MEFIGSLGWLIAVIWLILRALRQRGALRTVAPILSPVGSCPVQIVIPARDEAANIGRCLEALIKQAYPAFEISVVDDQSSDATPRIVAAFAERDPRVRLLCQPGVGQGAAATAALRQAEGDLVALAEPDGPFSLLDLGLLLG